MFVIQFDFAASAPSRDQCIYVPLMDPAFLMDRNRQLHYCVNRGYMLWVITKIGNPHNLRRLHFKKACLIFVFLDPRVIVWHLFWTFKSLPWILLTLNNKQRLYYLYRERNGLLNHTVPLFPPLIGEKGDFVYFVSGADMDPRNLTCDGMAPWSDCE